MRIEMRFMTRLELVSPPSPVHLQARCGFWPEDLPIQTIGGQLAIYTARAPAATSGPREPGDI
jgi:hypothetical protein